MKASLIRLLSIRGLAIASMITLGLGLVLMNPETATSEEKPVAEEAAAESSEEKALEALAASANPPAKRVVEQGCLVDPSAIEDLRKRREELDARQKTLAQKEAEIKAKESAIEEELKRLEEMKDLIAVQQGQVDAQTEEKVAKLVETIENMSPKKASELISTVDEKLAIVAMTRISTAKLSKIMNNIEPARAARLSESMTGYLNPRKAATPTAPMAQKGVSPDGSR